MDPAIHWKMILYGISEVNGSASEATIYVLSLQKYAKIKQVIVGRMMSCYRILKVSQDGFDRTLLETNALRELQVM